MIPKFKIGDKVLYAPEDIIPKKTYEAIVVHISVHDGVKDLPMPLYTVEWPPKGHGVAWERELSLIEEFDTIKKR